MIAESQIGRTGLRRRVALPDLSHHALNVWRRDRDVYLKQWRTELFLPLIEPLLVLFAMGLGLGRFVDLSSRTTYIRFLAPGVLAQFAMFQATFECSWGAYFKMETHGTYTAIASTPATLDDVTVGEIMWAATRALVNSGYILVVLLAFTPGYGIVRSPTALLALPVAYLLGFCFAAMSLCFTAVSPSISFLGYYFNLIIFPIFWLSGTFFPLERLPGWLQDLAWALPLTQATSIYRHLLDGSPEWQDLLHLGMLVCVSAAFAYVATILIRRRLIK